MIQKLRHCALFILTAALTLLAALPIQAQSQGTTKRIKVHGKSLEGNLAGDSPERDVSVYLPPGYGKDKKKRYPVVYLLHGYTDSDAKTFGLERHWMSLPEVLNKAYADGQLAEMILVTPNAYTRFQGSMYSNSATTGNWEEYIAKELVAAIDSRYRTIPQAASRGLAGHSMGGYGALRIGQNYPEVFSALYLLSPCCLEPQSFVPQDSASIARLQAIRTQEDFEKADFRTKAAFASAAAWSPNPQKPPFYLDLPVENGKAQPQVLTKWNANRPLVNIDQHIFNIRKLRGLAFDAGNQDRAIAASIKELDQVLNTYGIQHAYEEYDGNHTNRVADRIQTRLLPFFAKHLATEQKQKK